MIAFRRKFKRYLCNISRIRSQKRLYTILLIGIAYLGVFVILSNIGEIFDSLFKIRMLFVSPVMDARETLKKLAAERQACRIPDLDVNNPTIMKLIRYVPRLVCKEEEDWVQIDGSTARITEKALQRFGQIQCHFTDLLRSSDDINRDGVTTITHTEYNFKKTDFVCVQCKSGNNTWRNVMAGIRHDQNVLDRTGWDKVPKDGLRLNVLMWGFDSLSRNMFARKLPRTLRYLRETLAAFELEGYNIVGDGTPQALIPMFTGKTELELPETRKRMGKNATYVNIYPFVWNYFRANGYVTGFTEDAPNFATFTYRLKGFNSSPTEHYGRPFYLQIWKYYSGRVCLGSIPRHKVMMNYVHDFFKVYWEKPKFMFAFHKELSHDSYNAIGGADDDTQEWLQTLYEEGHLNSTLLIVMSDHGHRFAKIRDTQQGKQEERLPFFSFVFPQWFIRAYPEAIANLRLNLQRLTTPFDIHPTLLNVLHYEGSGRGDIRHRSISLFKEVPLGRTCADADIEAHWCACLDWKPVNISAIKVRSAAVASVKFINGISEEKRDLCSLLRLDSVVWAARLVPTKALLRFRKSSDFDGYVPDLSARTRISEIMYQLKLRVQPGAGLYEISLTHMLTNNTFLIKESDISRIDRYAPFVHCIAQTHMHLRKYCYCRGSNSEQLKDKINEITTAVKDAE